MYFNTQDIYAGHWKRFMAASLVLTGLLFTAFPLISRFEPERRYVYAREISSVKLRRPVVRRDTSRAAERPEAPRPPVPNEPKLFAVPRPDAALNLQGIALEPAAANISLDFKVTPDAADASRIFNFEQVDIAPEPVSKVLPVYPLKARILGIEGSVELVFVVRPDGSVERIRIESASPEGMFERVAVAAVGKWKYSPAKKDGVNVSSWVRLPLKFTLQHDQKETTQQ